MGGWREGGPCRQEEPEKGVGACVGSRTARKLRHPRRAEFQTHQNLNTHFRRRVPALARTLVASLSETEPESALTWGHTHTNTHTYSFIRSTNSERLSCSGDCARHVAPAFLGFTFTHTHTHTHVCADDTCRHTHKHTDHSHVNMPDDPRKSCFLPGSTRSHAHT